MKNTDSLNRSSQDSSAVLRQQSQNQGVQALLWHVHDAVQAAKMLEMGGTSIALEAKHAIADSLVPAFGKLVGFY